jgi:hypothetical protein
MGEGIAKGFQEYVCDRINCSEVLNQPELYYAWLHCYLYLLL